MSTYVEGIEFVSIQCGGCGVLFAMTSEFQRKRREDRKDWHCPNGCCRHYTGPTEADKLKSELERKTQMLYADARGAEFKVVSLG